MAIAPSLTRAERLQKFIKEPEHLRNSIKHLTDRHLQVIAMRKAGMQDPEIAKAMGLSIGWVSVIRNSWLAQKEAARLDELRDDETLDLMGKLRRGSELAAKYLMEALDIETAAGAKMDAMPTLKVKVATDMLDRNPEAAKVTRVQSSKISVQLNSDDLIRIKERARANKEAAKTAQIEQNEPIDVTPKEVQDAAT